MADITIQDVRAKYPQYSDMSDDQLAGALHQKFYSDMPEDQFRQKIGMKPAGKEKNPYPNAAGLAETVMHVGSQVAAFPVAGVAAAYQELTSPSGLKARNANQAVQSVQEAMTYQPRSEAGQAGARVADTVLGLPGRAADYVTSGIAENPTVKRALGPTGSEYLEAGANVALQAAPALFGPKIAESAIGRGASAGAKSAGSAASRAQAYVASRTGLDWGSLSAEFKARLENIAKDATALDKLDPKAVERQGRLASLPKPITNPTKGQLTRDPLQQRTEQLVKATESGKELRDLDVQQNKDLLENLDILKGRAQGTGKAEGPLQTGQSVQGALRSRYAGAQAKVRKLYREAEKAGELQGPVNIDRLVEYLKNSDDPAEVAYVRSRLAGLKAIKEETNGGITVESNRPLTLSELEGIRRAAVAKGKSGGTAAHYASEVKDVIDQITDGSGGEKYKAARAARKALGDEFERTSAISRLVKNRKLSKDRATALEDTWHKTVINGSLEDITKVRRSLLAGGEKGRAAWGDVRAATVDYLKDKATGGRMGLRNESGDLHATWGALKRAYQDIGEDKLKFILGEKDAATLKNIVDAAQDLKTEAPTGVKGSPTMDKLLTFLDRIGRVPGLGRATELAGGVAKGVSKVAEIGKTGREIRAAKKTPLDEAEESARARKRHTLRDLTPAGAVTLQDHRE